MKKVNTYFASIALAFVLFSVMTNAEEPKKNFYQRLSESAHPVPVYTKTRYTDIPLSKAKKLPIFFNASMAVNEEGDAMPTQNESSIAVNPKNPKNLISSAVDYRANSSTWVYVSSDGGKTWVNHNLGHPYPDWRSTNDPSVFFDNDGTGYLVYGGFPANNTLGENGVFMAKTTDEGKTWEAHKEIIVHKGPQKPEDPFEDKYYIQVDNSKDSPYQHHLYVPWKRVTAKDSATQIVITKSIDKGNTWTEPISVSHRVAGSSEDTTFGQSFPLTTTGPKGQVYLVWNHGVKHAVGFVKSMDGGKTWTEPKFPHHYNIFGHTKMLTGQGYRHTLKGKVRAEAYPVIVCDITSETRKGNLYLCWAADQTPNIYFSKSEDEGETWSKAKVLHSTEKNDQFWPWISIDPTNGDLAVMYLDSRTDPDNIKVECWVSYSNDGGDTWVDRRVADESSDLRNNPFSGNAFAGDYSGCAFHDGIIYPSWVDMRAAEQVINDNDVYTAVVNTRAPEPVKNFDIHILADNPKQLNLSWKKPTVRTFGQDLGDDFKYLLLRDGKKIQTFEPAISTFEDKNLDAYTKYKYEIYAFSGKDTSLVRTKEVYAGGDPRPGHPMLTYTLTNNHKTIKFEATMPSLRADGVTKLSNLKSLTIYRDKVKLKTITLTPLDTGKVIDIEDTPDTQGYFTYYVTVSDNASAQGGTDHESLNSEHHIEFLGDIKKTFSNNFDTKTPVKIYATENWTLTNKFSFSKPQAITESADGLYKYDQRDTILNFPIDCSSFDKFSVFMTHVAQVHYEDSAFVEVRFDDETKWNVVANFDDLMFPAWKKRQLTPEDWRKDRIVINCAGKKTATVRFRFWSNGVREKEGWYIDDVDIQEYDSSVEDSPLENGNDITIYPNPSRNYLNINLDNNSFSLNETIQINDIYGNIINISNTDISRSSNNILINIAHLPSGIYGLTIIDAKNKKYRKTFSIVK